MNKPNQPDILNFTEIPVETKAPISLEIETI